MNETLKRRMVGAVVLVALGVIFIPFILDGRGGGPTVPLSSSNVPPQPDYKFETIEIPLQVPAPADAPVRRVVETPAEAEKPAPALVEPPPAPADEPKAVADAPLPDGAGPEAWVVQVGSFSRADNAFGLRDRLRAKGFASFVEEVKGDGKTVYRVRVGPEKARTSADALQQRIRKSVAIDGLVMRHP